MKINIKTWKCECGYKIDCEPTQENMDLHFNSDPQFRVSNLQANQCPSCALRKVVGTLVEETDENKKISVEIMDEDKLDTHEITDKDTKEKRPLTSKEKEEMKQKIKSDIEKFSKMR